MPPGHRLATVCLPCPPLARRSMSVSRPNCITTYVLACIRLLRGDDLLDPNDSGG